MYLRAVRPPLRRKARSLRVFIVIPHHTIMNPPPKGTVSCTVFDMKCSKALIQTLTPSPLPDRTNLDSSLNMTGVNDEVASLSVFFQIQIFFNDVLWSIWAILQNVLLSIQPLLTYCILFGH
jgi:hypothetical protein